MLSEIKNIIGLGVKNSFFVLLFRIFKYKGYKMGLLRYGSFAEMKRYMGM